MLTTLCWLAVVAPGALLVRAARSGRDRWSAPSWRAHPRRTTGPPLRIAVGRLLGVVVVGALVVVAVARILSDREPVEPVVAGAEFWPPAFVDEPHGRDLWEQMATLPEHVADVQLGWRNAPEATAPLISIRDGVRVTRAPEGRPEAVVWLFGGSTAYGVGQRDDHTVASELVRAAAAQGRSVEVVNLGVSGYVAWQEALVFARALDEGALPEPDVAVFYHRSNDLNAVCRRIAEGLAPDEPLAGIEVSDRFELSPPTSVRAGAPCVDRVDEAAAALADQVQLAMDEARRVAGARGIEVVEAWQPDAWTVAATPAHQPTFDRLLLDGGARDAMVRIIEAARAQVRPRPVDLRGALDESERTVLFDWNHTNEHGARLVAERLWPSVASALEADR